MSQNNEFICAPMNNDMISSGVGVRGGPFTFRLVWEVIDRRNDGAICR